MADHNIPAKVGGNTAYVGFTGEAVGSRRLRKSLAGRWLREWLDSEQQDEPESHSSCEWDTRRARQQARLYLPFETAIIERYRGRESSVEEALAEIYLAGASVRRAEDITEALWGTRFSPSTDSELNQKIYA